MPRGTLSSSRGRARRKSPRGSPDDDDIPEVYLEMLAEADAQAAAHQADVDRPVKRRKVGERSTRPQVDEKTQPDRTGEQDSRQIQTVYDLDASDDSDLEWEEVEIQQVAEPLGSTDEQSNDEPLQIMLDKALDDKPKAAITRRKPLSGAEKKLRLQIHKMHVLCLLGHVHIRNLWCNDDEVQQFLKRALLTKQIISFLNPKETMSQFTRSTTFIDGLKRACEAFSRNFKTTSPGLRRPHWAEDPMDLKHRAESIMRDAEMIASRDDFRRQAKTFRGSRDFGAQMFCALLRSAAVEARLVCSLQVLPFSGVAKGMSPMKPKREYIVISSDDHTSSSDDRTRTQSNTTPPKTRRLGQPQFKTPIRSSSSATTFTGPPKFQSSPHPVFWVEAFNEAVQKWIPVDPLVTKSIAKASKFEPPASDRYNNMSYVVAFEEDASAKDVTRRYAKAFNGKTRKTRVESTKDGERWWTTAIAHFEKPFLEDRDQLEVSELTAKSAAEPMPRNIQDFKDHPVYALERHLRRNEVLYPKRVIGQVNVGKSGSKKNTLEPVYRRADVHVVRSADGWYRLGRDIKVGEQPLKRIAPTSSRTDVGTDDEDLTADRPLYAIHQTEVYQPPPVVKGKIPKNAYGNLDVYVPSMVPPGAFHLKHPDAARAARTLGVDYADAVTGFEFKGRHGTAVVSGIVVATQYREAIEEVLRCIQDERLQAELDRKSEQALRLWKHFLLKLRIAEKVKNYVFEGEDAEGPEGHENDNDPMDFDGGGGFLPESDEEIAQPTSAAMGIADFGSVDAQEHLPDSLTQGAFVPPHEAFDGGGFMPELNMAETDPVDLQPDAVPNAISEPPNLLSRRTSETRPRYKLIVVPKGQQDSTLAPLSMTQIAGSEKQSDASERVERQLPVADPSIPAQGSSEAAPILVDSSTGPGSTPASLEVLSQPSSGRSQLGQQTSGDSDSNLEQRSMLSHDPEDEDAEPEWLMSD